MKLSDLVSQTKTVIFDFNGNAVELEARTAALTPRMLAEAAAAVQAGDPLAQSVQVGVITSEMVSKLVASWNLTGDDGEAYPLDVASLSDLPLGFLSAVVNAIQGSLGEAPAPTSGATSDATSSRKGK